VYIINSKRFDKWRNAFITTWEIPDDDFEFTFPTAPFSGGVYDYYIDWGDGSEVEHYTDDTPPTHEYALEGEYSIKVRGSLPRVAIANGSAKTLLLGVDNWGDGSEVEHYTDDTPPTHEYALEGEYSIKVRGSLPRVAIANGSAKTLSLPSPNSVLLGVDNWGDVGFRSFYQMFYGCTRNFYIPNTLTGHNNVTDMGLMFYHTIFDQDISEWDVSRIVDMNGMFQNSKFNQDISGWNVSNVKYMQNMFRASDFNKDIGLWDVGNVENMSSMFLSSKFNQDISGWNVSNVQGMLGMFRSATSFNKDIGSWIVSKVTNMEQMFYSATSFNQDLSGWCVENIASEPTDFATGATAWVLPKPNWGAPCS